MRNLALLAGLLMLFGCATPTPTERAAHAQQEMQQLMAVYGPACEKLGYARDTDLWRDCVLRLATREELRTRPTSTTCIGNRGFIDCTTF